MKFSMQQTDLKQTLDKIVGIIPNNPPIPTLNFMKLQIDNKNGGIKFTATDLNTWLLTISKYINNSSNGDESILVPGKNLYEIVNLLPSDEVHFNVKEKRIGISCQNIKHKIAIVDPSEYPKEQCLLKENNYFALPRVELQTGLEAVAFATKRDAYSPLNGILFDLRKNKLRLVATDIHRLGVYSIPIHNENEQRLIVPSSIVKYVSKMEGEEIRMFAENELIGFYAPNLGLTSRLLEGDYPDYESVIPHDNDKELLADRKELIQALRQVEISARYTNELVEVSAKKNASSFTLSTKGESFESQAEIECKYKGEDIRMGLNARYLLQSLYAIPSKNIKWTFKDSSSPMILQPEQCNQEHYYLLMPMILV